MKIYKTGDICPCCGQPIKLTDPDELYAFSVFVSILNLGLLAGREVGVNDEVD